MVHKVTIELPDDLYRSAEQTAAGSGLGLQEWLVRQIGYAAPTAEMLQRSRQRLMRFAGAATPPDADNSHNERIDRDLADEYASTHDEPA